VPVPDESVVEAHMPSGSSVGPYLDHGQLRSEHRLRPSQRAVQSAEPVVTGHSEDEGVDGFAGVIPDDPLHLVEHHRRVPVDALGGGGLDEGEELVTGLLASVAFEGPVEPPDAPEIHDGFGPMGVE